MEPHSSRALPHKLLGALVLALSAACGDETPQPAAIETPVRAPTGGAPGPSAGLPSAAARERLADIERALVPPSDESTSDVTDTWLRERRALLLELHRPDRDLGRECLRVLQNGEELRHEVRRDLMEIASWAVPEEAAGWLREVFETYGQDLGLRASAMEALAQADPAQASDLLEPLLQETRPTRTWPPTERMLATWILCQERLGRDPTALLGRIATDIHRDDAARHLAVRELGLRPGTLAAQALESVLVESTGNFYLRRLAAQSLRDVLDEPTACALFRRVADREADPGFLNFLADMLEKHCH